MKRQISKIRLMRENQGYSQRDMARKMGCSQPWYGKLERGEVSMLPRERQKVARILRCKVSDLFTPKTKLPKKVKAEIKTRRYYK